MYDVVREWRLPGDSVALAAVAWASAAATAGAETPPEAPEGVPCPPVPCPAPPLPAAWGGTDSPGEASCSPSTSPALRFVS